MMRRLLSALALWPALAFAGDLPTIAPTAPTATNNNQIATTAWVNNFVNAGLPLTSGKIWIGSAGNIATPQTISGDCTLSVLGVVVCTKTNGVAFATSATTDTTNAANISSGTLPTGRMPALTGDCTTISGAVATTCKKTQIVKQAFTANGTYTPTTGMAYAIIECPGGGGAGGGVAGAAGDIFVAGGGGSGGYSRVLVTAAAVGASKAVTIGVGGTPGAAGANNGGAGGDTSVGALCVGKGGGGGYVNSAASTVAGGAGGSGFVIITEFLYL